MKKYIEELKGFKEQHEKELEILEEKEEEIIEKFGEFDDYLKEIAGDTRLYDNIKYGRY